MGKREQINIDSDQYEMIQSQIPEIGKIVHKTKTRTYIKKKDLYEIKESCIENYTTLCEILDHANDLNNTKHINQEYPKEFEKNVEVFQNPQINQDWIPCFMSVVGKAHLKRNPPVPCQDSSLALNLNRPIAIVADGAGSSFLSHKGSKQVVLGLNRLIFSLEDICSSLLDNNEPNNFAINAFANRLIKHSIGLIEDLSIQEKQSFDAYKCTLLFTLLGTYNLFWLKIGDGAIIIESNEKLMNIGPNGKGEYANQTTFLSKKITSNEFSFGVMPLKGVTGVLLCSDGAGEKLISNNGIDIAPAVKKMFSDCRRRYLDNVGLYEFLVNDTLWKTTTGDDKSICILSLITNGEN